MRNLRPIATILAAILVSAAHAQLRLPVAPPALPVAGATQLLDATQSRTLAALSQVRLDEVRRLLRSHSVEADPDGNPVVRGEILALGASDAALAQAAGLGATIEGNTGGDAFEVIVIKSPQRLPTAQLLRMLRDADPAGLYDFDHLYLHGGSQSSADAPAPTPPPTPAPSHSARPRVGLVDSGIEVTHPAFAASTIHTWGCADHAVPAAHGTEVASLLVRRAPAELFAADVYCGSPTGGAVDALIAALGWLAAQRVAVINVSLVGPQNLLLEHVVRLLIEQGHLIVAAVGNDGPAAPPLFPAAYPNVVGVTAVDAHRHVLLEAGRGPQVMFAAQGADMLAATLEHRNVPVRGTSYAAPSVAALLAPALPAPERQAADTALRTLAARALHLGSPGKDLTYGFGLVGSEDR